MHKNSSRRFTLSTHEEPINGSTFAIKIEISTAKSTEMTLPQQRLVFQSQEQSHSND